MLRLELMPLVSDFGETLKHPIDQINPYTRLKFTRDYRIFAQLSNFPDSRGGFPDQSIKTRPLPNGLTIGTTIDDEVTFSRNDESGEMNWVYAKKLKTLDIPKDTSKVNKAIKAYIDQLSDNTPVILRWD